MISVTEKQPPEQLRRVNLPNKETDSNKKRFEEKVSTQPINLKILMRSHGKNNEQTPIPNHRHGMFTLHICTLILQYDLVKSLRFIG